MARTRRRAGANRSAGSKRASNTKSRRVKASGTKTTKRQAPAKHSSKRSSRATRSRGAVGSRGPRGGREAAIVLIGAVPTASLEEPESELQSARRDAQSMVGDELPGGTVAMPEQDNVDEFAEALGVERSPDAPLRGSAEILDRRDRRRGGRKPSPSL